jgi:alpha-D-ribose 1-methylphosphonate 5-triphosphate diphosphatase
VVTPGQVLEEATVVIEGNKIVEVGFNDLSGNSEDKIIDVSGRYVLPGLIDLHNDGIEKEVSPRPRARFSAEWALMNYDRYLAANGITTEFHALYFANIGGVRTMEDTVKISQAISRVNAKEGYLIRHCVLHRYEASRGDGMAEILACLSDTPVKLMSINDHTPGQGQYRKLKTAAEVSLALKGILPQPSEKRPERCTAEEVALNIQRVMRLAQGRGVVIASHDDDSPEKVEMMHQAGAKICEFPVTLEAARRARELDMVISMGASNVMLGGSLSGNVSAAALIAHGLVDVLVSDYYAPALLASVFHLPRLGLMSLIEAVNLVTLNPAAAVGLDRELGSVEAGKQADLIVVNVSQDDPIVEGTIVNGRLRYATSALLDYEKSAVQSLR